MPTIKTQIRFKKNSVKECGCALPLLPPDLESGSRPNRWGGPKRLHSAHLHSAVYQEGRGTGRPAECVRSHYQKLIPARGKLKVGSSQLMKRFITPHLQEVFDSCSGVLGDLGVDLGVDLQLRRHRCDAWQAGRVLNKKKDKKQNQFPRLQWRAAFYLPPVPEVYNVHVGLLDVPLQVLWALLLLHVHCEGQLIILQSGLRYRLQHERGVWGRALTRPRWSNNKPAGRSSPSPLYLELTWGMLTAQRPTRHISYDSLNSIMSSWTLVM